MRRTRLLIFVTLGALVVLGSLSWIIFAGEPPESSPFTDVTFNQKVEVVYDGTSYELLEVEGIPTSKLIDFAKRRYDDKWQEHIAEDLPEVLSGLWRRIDDTVSLKLFNPVTGETIVIAEAAMTAANRRTVMDTRAARNIPHAHTRFVEAIRNRWSYYDYRKEAIEERLSDLEHRIADLPAPGPEAFREFLLAMQWVIAAGVDGHANTADSRVAIGAGRDDGRLPFLIEPIESRYVAFSEDRKELLDKNRPYILTLDGRSIDEWVDVAGSIEPQGSPQFVKRRALQNLRYPMHWRRALGEEETDGPVRIGLADASGADVREITLPLGERTPVYGIWPRSESRVLSDRIGYLRLEEMNETAIEEIAKWMPKFRDTIGLIIDVRGNSGGRRDPLRELAAYLLAPSDTPIVVNTAKYLLHPAHSKDHLTNRFLYRQNSLEWSDAERRAIHEFRQRFQPEWTPPAERFSEWHFMVVRRGGEYHYSKPVVVLQNASCFSATDIFLAAMKELPNVTLLGTPSGGGSARAKDVRLSDGFHVRLGSMVSFQPDGRLFDGVGVVPDIEIWPSPTDFVGKGDRVLEEAIKLLQK